MAFMSKGQCTWLDNEAIGLTSAATKFLSLLPEKGLVTNEGPVVLDLLLAVPGSESDFVP